MNIQGLQKMTLLDWPGRVACTVFLGGCDLRCPYCHNAELLEGPFPETVTQDELLAFLSRRRGLLDGVCVTGGEPLLRPDLPELLAAIRAAGFPVKLDYQLPPRLLPSHQAIHLLQIAREALSNALKHSQASEVVVTVAQNDNQVKLTVQDNGCGVPENAIRSNHYGMIIMRDRAQSLRGDCRVRRRESGGTEVVVTFIPEKTFTDVQGDTHE